MASLEYARAITATHEQEARRGIWRWRLRDLKREERAAKSKLPPVQAPASRNLNGAHSPWI